MMTKYLFFLMLMASTGLSAQAHSLEVITKALVREGQADSIVYTLKLTTTTDFGAAFPSVNYSYTPWMDTTAFVSYMTQAAQEGLRLGTLRAEGYADVEEKRRAYLKAKQADTLSSRIFGLLTDVLPTADLPAYDIPTGSYTITTSTGTNTLVVAGTKGSYTIDLIGDAPGPTTLKILSPFALRFGIPSITGTDVTLSRQDQDAEVWSDKDGTITLTAQ